MASQAKRLQRFKGRQGSQTFAAMPHKLMDTEDFRSLSGNALKLLCALLYQYRGKNNGDLSCAFTDMQAWGFCSKTTLAKAKAELLNKNLIVQTRAGYFQNPHSCCSLYALSWRAIDECNGKLEVAATSTPHRKLSLE